MEYIFSRRVAFYETDCMGIVHHSVYPKFFEEARVEWLYKLGLQDHHAPVNDYTLALIDLQVSYLKPLKVCNEFKVSLEACYDKSKVEFIYSVKNSNGDIVATGKTLHIGLDKNLKPRRLPEVFHKVMEKK